MVIPFFAEQLDDGGCQVNLADTGIKGIGFDQAGCVKNQGDVIARNRQFGLASHGCAVVCRDDEQGVFEPALAARLVQKLANGVVGVFHPAFTP